MKTKTKFKKSLIAIAAGAGLLIGAAGGADAIVSGAESAQGARPYQVSLQSGGPHPKYGQTELADIAVIKLAEPLKLGGAVQAIPLATAAQVGNASTGVVSGWGAVSENGEASNNLLEATVPLVADASCKIRGLDRVRSGAGWCCELG